jgi:peptidoglycan/LPS O-acetylase OafA/YrhL
MYAARPSIGSAGCCRRGPCNSWAISYSVYVWSFFVLDALTNILKSSEPSIEAIINSVLRVVVAVGLTTVFAYGSFVLTENPSRRWLRAVLAGSKSKAGAAAAESQH